MSIAESAYTPLAVLAAIEEVFNTILARLRSSKTHLSSPSS
jgi:small basic protein